MDISYYVDADVIARGLSGLAAASAALEAGRIMLERLHALADQRADFAFETTMAGRSLARRLTELKRLHVYRVVVRFVSLSTADLAIARVAARVSRGGHDVPEATIRRLFRVACFGFRFFIP